MRMFLVAMCDLFLLLYLTTLVQSGGRAPSKLTVADYMKVQQAQQETASKVEELKSRIQQEAMQREQLENSRAAALQELERLREHESELQGHLVNASSEKEDLSSKLTQVSEQASQIEQQRDELMQQVDQLNQRLLNAQQNQEQLAQRMEQQLTEVEQARVKAEAARLEAEKTAAASLKARDSSREMAEATEQRARMAEQQAQLLAAQLDEARQRAQETALQMEKAEAQREQAEDLASTASRVAESARMQAKKLNSELKNINQASDTAFEKQIEPHIVQVRSIVKTENLLGSTTRRFNTRAVAARFKGFTVVFQYLPEIGLESGDTTRDLDIRVDDAPIESVLVAPGSQVIGLIVPDSHAQAFKVKDLRSDNLMPTLIAIRNDSAIGMWDRLRDVERNYLAIQRDALHLQGDHHLAYRLEGFRGTGDFAGQILPGDYLVDLSGTLIGVADNKNSVLLPNKINNWHQAGIYEAFPQKRG